MSRSLREKQSVFVLNLALLVLEAGRRGYELTLGDGYRDPRVFGRMGEQGPYGRPSSNHKVRLAQDYNLFIDGEYQAETEAHRELGRFWESLHPDNVWGGSNSAGDGNHYSMTHDGRW